MTIHLARIARCKIFLGTSFLLSCEADIIIARGEKDTRTSIVHSPVKKSDSRISTRYMYVRSSVYAWRRMELIFKISTRSLLQTAPCLFLRYSMLNQPRVNAYGKGHAKKLKAILLKSMELPKIFTHV